MSQTLKTNCKGCVFAQTNTEDTQIGCSLGRHEKLGVDKLEEKNFVTSRFCNTYRPEEWFNDLDLEESMEPEFTVLDEVYPRLCLFIRLKTEIDKGRNESIQSLEVTLDSLLEIDDPNIASVAVITDKVEYNEQIWEALHKRLGESDTKYHVVQMSFTPEDMELLMDASFQHAQNGWVRCVESGDAIPKNILTVIHEAVNKDMLQLLMIDSDDFFSGVTFPSFLFKFLNGNKPKVFEDTRSITGSFVDKLKSAEKQSGTKTIYSWAELNAS